MNARCLALQREEKTLLGTTGHSKVKNLNKKRLQNSKEKHATDVVLCLAQLQQCMLSL